MFIQVLLLKSKGHSDPFCCYLVIMRTTSSSPICSDWLCFVLKDWWCWFSFVQTKPEDNMNFAAIIDGVLSVSRYGTEPSPPAYFSDSFSVCLIKASCFGFRKKCRDVTLLASRPLAKLHRKVLHLQWLPDHPALLGHSGVDSLQECGGHLWAAGGTSGWL